MKNNDVLSEKARTFINDLRVYLFSSGKKEKEIDEIIEELEDHLIEAEQNGKPIEKFVGKSPKEYMQRISQEMTIDYRTWIKYFALILIGSFAFNIYKDVLAGPLSYSVLQIVGHITVITLSLILLFGTFKYISGKGFSNTKQIIIIAGPVVLSSLLFFGLFFLNRIVSTPIIHFGTIGTVIIMIFTTIFIIAFSFWAKSWILIITLMLITLPEYVLSKTALNIETQLIFSTLITYAGIGLYVLYVFRKYND